jgi:hypothetical protein
MVQKSNTLEYCLYSVSMKPTLVSHLSKHVADFMMSANTYLDNKKKCGIGVWIALLLESSKFFCVLFLVTKN